jgi:hypothetical protein
VTADESPSLVRSPSDSLVAEPEGSTPLIQVLATGHDPEPVTSTSHEKLCLVVSEVPLKLFPPQHEYVFTSHPECGRLSKIMFTDVGANFLVLQFTIGLLLNANFSICVLN